LNIIAIMIGRGGSSLKDKNILPVHGVPLLSYAAAAAKRSKFISDFYISSDCPKILKVGFDSGFKKIKRPQKLSTSTAQSCDAVLHALEIIEKTKDVDIVVVQHANVGTITEKIIDDCIQQLIDNKNYSAVVPVHEKSEYNPYRAKKISQAGLLSPFINDSKISANRQDLPKSYFFDHSVWILRSSSIKNKDKGQAPWGCMGNQIKPYITTGCLDVHSTEDIKYTEKWITENEIPIPIKNGKL
jgi:CMP-N-acetylneuraminic acid synthetase